MFTVYLTFDIMAVDYILNACSVPCTVKKFIYVNILLSGN